MESRFEQVNRKLRQLMTIEGIVVLTVGGIGYYKYNIIRSLPVILLEVVLCFFHALGLWSSCVFSSFFHPQHVFNKFQEEHLRYVSCTR